MIDLHPRSLNPILLKLSHSIRALRMHSVYLLSLLMISSMITHPSYGQQQAPQSYDLELEDTPLKPQDHKPRSILFPPDQPEPYIPPQLRERLQEQQSDDFYRQQDPDGTTSTADITDKEGEIIAQHNGQDIIVGSLKEKPSAARGLTLKGQNALPHNLWLNSKIDVVTGLIQQSPYLYYSPTLSALYTNILYNELELPDYPGKSMPPRDTESGTDFSNLNTDEIFANSVLVTDPQSQDAEPIQSEDAHMEQVDLVTPYLTAKIERIVETGRLDQILPYFNLLDDKDFQNNLKALDVLFLTEQWQRACLINDQSSHNTPASDQYAAHLKITLLCKILNNDLNGARFNYEMLNELDPEDMVFLDLSNRLIETRHTALNTNEARLNTPPLETALTSQTYDMSSLVDVSYEPAHLKMTALHFTALSLLDLIPSDEQISTASPHILSAVALSPVISYDIRLHAAQTAFNQGAFSIDLLRNIYLEKEFSSTEYDSAVALAATDEGYNGDILLFQSALKLIDPAEKAKSLAALYQRALNRHDYSRVATLTKPILMQLTPDPALLPYAAHIARALVNQKMMPQAIRWYQLITDNANNNPDASKALMEIWPLMVIADQSGQVPWSEEILDYWWYGQTLINGDDKNEKAALFYAIAEIHGYTVPETMWQKLTADQTETNKRSLNYIQWRSLLTDSHKGLKGEVSLKVLYALRQDALWTLDPAALTSILRALKRVNLVQETHDLSGEILIHNGL